MHPMLLMKAIWFVKLFKPEFFYHTGNKGVTFFSIDMFKLEMSLLPDRTMVTVGTVVGHIHCFIEINYIYIGV